MLDLTGFSYTTDTEMDAPLSVPFNPQEFGSLPLEMKSESIEPIGMTFDEPQALLLDAENMRMEQPDDFIDEPGTISGSFDGPYVDADEGYTFEVTGDASHFLDFGDKSLDGAIHHNDLNIDDALSRREVIGILRFAGIAIGVGVMFIPATAPIAGAVWVLRGVGWGFSGMAWAVSYASASSN